MAFTNYLEEGVMNHVFGTGTFAKPAGLYLALFTSAPGETGGGTEVGTNGTGYERQVAQFTVTAGNPTRATTSAPIEYSVALADWGEITHVAVFDAKTGGNMLAYAELDVSKIIGEGDVFRVPAQDLTFTLE